MTSEMTKTASEPIEAHQRLFCGWLRGMASAARKRDEGQAENEEQQVHRRPPPSPRATINSTEPNSTQVA